MATSTNAAIVKASGRDLCEVTGGGSRSDTLGSPALRASEQPLERGDERAFCDTHTVTKFIRESKRFRMLAVGFLGRDALEAQALAKKGSLERMDLAEMGRSSAAPLEITASFLFSLATLRLSLRAVRSRTLCGLFRRVARVRARPG